VPAIRDASNAVLVDAEHVPVVSRPQVGPVEVGQVGASISRRGGQRPEAHLGLRSSSVSVVGAVAHLSES